MPRLGKEFVQGELRRIVTSHEERWLKKRPCPVIPTDREIYSELMTGRYKFTMPKCGCKVRSNFNGYSDHIKVSDFIVVPVLVRYKNAAKRHQEARKEFMAHVKAKSHDIFKKIYYGAITSEEGMAEIEAFKIWKPVLTNRVG